MSMLRLLILVALCQAAVPSRGKSILERCRALLFGVSTTPTHIDARNDVFEAWLHANLNFPQRAFASTIAISSVLLKPSASIEEFYASKLTRAQLARTRAAVLKVHSAYGIYPRGIEMILTFTLRPLLNQRIQAIWSALGISTIRTMGAVISEIDRAHFGLLDSEERRGLAENSTPYHKAKALDRARSTPRYEKLVKTSTAVFEVFEAALRYPSFRRAAAEYRNTMRGGRARAEVDEAERLRRRFREAALEVLRSHPIEGIGPEDLADLYLYVCASSI